MKLIVLCLLIVGISHGSAFAQTKQIVQPKSIPTSSYPFSLGVISKGFLFVAGQVGTNPQTGKLVPGGVEAETAQTIQTIKTILEAAGTSLDDVVTVTVYLSNMDDFARMNAVYQTFFKAGNHPARKTMGVAKLVFGASIGLAMTAAMPSAK